MRDTALKTLHHFLGLSLTTTGAVLTNATGIVLLIPILHFVFFIHTFFKWAEDESTEMTEFIEEVERLFKENPTIEELEASEKRKVTQQELNELYEHGKRRRRQRRR